MKQVLIAQQDKKYEKELTLLETVERVAPQVISQFKGTNAEEICANVDMYSGLVYRMLGIPDELFTPLFATARMVGWSAHRMEEILTGKRIIRPAYKAIAKRPVRKDVIRSIHFIV